MIRPHRTARTPAWTVAGLLLVLALAGCARDAGDPTVELEPSDAPTATAAPQPTDDGSPPPLDEVDRPSLDAGPGHGGELVGTIGGDETLEGGCLWLEVDGERYELSPAGGAGVQVDTTRLRLLDDAGEVIARAGDEVRVTGEVAEDLMSFCQIGPILQVTAVEPV